MLRSVASRRITVTENGRQTTMTWLEAIFTQTARAAVQGDTKAMDRMIRLLPAFTGALAAAREETAAGASAGGGIDGDEALAGMGSAADRAVLAFFAEQIARGDFVLPDEEESP